MQTFLPFTDPRIVANVLDQKRLGKQRVEGNQIIDLLEGRADNNWKFHPATRMWAGYEIALKYYINTMITAWVSRGRENNMERHCAIGPMPWPPWMRDPRLVYSHRANLVRKMPDYYGEIWPEADPKTPYWWPVELKTKKKQDMLNEFWGAHRCEASEDDVLHFGTRAPIFLVEDNHGGENYKSWHYSYD